MEIDVLLSNVDVTACWMPTLQTLVLQIGHRGNAMYVRLYTPMRVEPRHITAPFPPLRPFTRPFHIRWLWGPFSELLRSSPVLDSPATRRRPFSASSGPCAAVRYSGLHIYQVGPPLALGRKWRYHCNAVLWRDRCHHVRRPVRAG